MITAEDIKSLLALIPHEREGGYFTETYRSAYFLPKGALPPSYQGERSLSTAIYYLLTPDTFSALHRLPADEIFHFYLGDPVEMLQLFPDKSGKIITLGNDIASGMVPQVIVNQGVWQGSRLLPGGEFALLGATMSPGFEDADYEPGERNLLSKSYPQFRDLIGALTRNQ
jgi:predicted cupin superfamily sugar epimerase